MDTHDEPGARRAGEDRTDDIDRDRTHRAGPAQPDSGFAEGIEQRPDEPDEPDPDFARGVRDTPEETEVQGKFSRGQEQLPEDAPDKNVERRFSEGIEQRPRDN